uniref:hypothetical protein n=1 Tax=Salmonella enterica TaxID=28901 RepID=UPI00398C2A86
MSLINNRNRYSAGYGAGLWLDFPFTALLTVPDFMWGVAAYGAALRDPTLSVMPLSGSACCYNADPGNQIWPTKLAPTNLLHTLLLPQQ